MMPAPPLDAPTVLHETPVAANAAASAPAPRKKARLWSSSVRNGQMMSDGI